MHSIQLLLVAYFLILPVSSIILYNATVSLRGFGDFRTITAAIATAPSNSHSRFYINVKSGRYKEHVEIPPDKTFISLIGDDATNTVIVDDRSNRRGFGTSESATFVVKGNNFMATSIAFENSAGAENGQAVAFHNHANQTVYYKSRFLGFQDTLFVENYQIFFKDCEIYGTIDFIFGGGLAVFQDCKIYARLLNRTITITAQSKESKDQVSGFSFQNCSVLSSPELGPINEPRNCEVYLGRPWRDYATVIFMESFLDYIVNTAGWSAWSSDRPLDLLFYAEFNNRGPGSDLSGRVRWFGFHAITNSMQAAGYTVRMFIDGNEWLPETGIPFRLYLEF